VFVFPIEIKMRGVYVGGNEIKRECRECFLFFFYLLQYVFFKREIKKEVYMWEWWWERIRVVSRISFFGFVSFSYDRVRIYIHILQSQCNLSLNCNEQYKEGIDYDSNTLWESNHSKSEHKINPKLVILILTINKSEHKINPN